MNAANYGLKRIVLAMRIQEQAYPIVDYPDGNIICFYSLNVKYRINGCDNENSVIKVSAAMRKDYTSIMEKET